MSAFLFKQTETAGTDCACGAQTFGRGTGPAARARARTPAAPQGGSQPGRRRGAAVASQTEGKRLAAGRNR